MLTRRSFIQATTLVGIGSIAGSAIAAKSSEVSGPTFVSLGGVRADKGQLVMTEFVVFTASPVSLSRIGGARPLFSAHGPYRYVAYDCSLIVIPSGGGLEVYGYPGTKWRMFLEDRDGQVYSVTEAIQLKPLFI